jgi:hypothetical protein
MARQRDRCARCGHHRNQHFRISEIERGCEARIKICGPTAVNEIGWPCTCPGFESMTKERWKK